MLCRKLILSVGPCYFSFLKNQNQALAAQTEMDLDLRTSLLPGQKRRIAHTAKFDVSVNLGIFGNIW